MAAESAYGADEAEELRQTVFSAGPVFCGGRVLTTDDAILAAAGTQLGGEDVSHAEDGVAR